MAGFINRVQFERDHNGQRNICAADGFRVHLSDTTDPASGYYGQRQEG
ncbi:hypothetical protein [Streptomyces glaucus]|uniref:Uncharacterized protein n=1 Tax=Streptomyces glaucus TaxID=284029 RepID=A0ABP5X150_9ACTN